MESGRPTRDLYERALPNRPRKKLKRDLKKIQKTPRKKCPMESGRPTRELCERALPNRPRKKLKRDLEKNPKDS